MPAFGYQPSFEVVQDIAAADPSESSCLEDEGVAAEEVFEL